jgi:energy-coupling factor transporter ATP-binding protein EcfA2
VTILAGPNGSGKTHILKLLQALLRLNLYDLLQLPYRGASLTFSDGAQIIANKSGEGRYTTLDLLIERPGRRVVNHAVRYDEFEPLEEILPPWVIKVGDDHYFDEKSGTTLSTLAVERRYRTRIERRSNARSILSQHPELKPFFMSMRPELIDTKRLETPQPYRSAAEYRRSPDRDHTERIVEYIQQVEMQIENAQRESLSKSKESDRNFAFDLLKGRRRKVDHSSLVTKYEYISRQNEELSQNGLTKSSISVDVPDDADETERRALDLFLTNWEAKLAPLIAVHEKLTLLKRIVNSKFIGTRINFTPEGKLEFRSATGSRVDVSQLSSGEQHLFALFTQLLFSANKVSVVLIDEPEISLHASWKHEFVEDIEEVAKVSQLRIVLATHSTAIVNGRWELVQELGVAQS